MTDTKWREELDLLVEKNLNELLRETKEFDYAIAKSKDRGKAQMWVALALVNAKLNKILVDKKEYKPKMTKEELKSVMDTLEHL